PGWRDSTNACREALAGGGDRFGGHGALTRRERGRVYGRSGPEPPGWRLRQFASSRRLRDVNRETTGLRLERSAHLVVDDIPCRHGDVQRARIPAAVDLDEVVEGRARVGGGHYVERRPARVERQGSGDARRSLEPDRGEGGGAAGHGL